MSSESGTALCNGKSDSWNMNILFICVTPRPESQFSYEFDLNIGEKKRFLIKRIESRRGNSLIYLLRFADDHPLLRPSEYPRVLVEEDFFLSSFPSSPEPEPEPFKMYEIGKLKSWNFILLKPLHLLLFVESCEENF